MIMKMSDGDTTEEAEALFLEKLQKDAAEMVLSSVAFLAKKNVSQISPNTYADPKFYQLIVSATRALIDAAMRIKKDQCEERHN